MVSLHTMVVYFPKSHQKAIQSYVAVSNVLSHNATVVYTILKKLVPLVKTEFPDVQQIHYLTDSPSSQYRNKTIFQIVCEHEADFGAKARWNYLETGHGKGPCDGLGASVKRMADMAVKQEKCSIQDACDFYEWVNNHANESKVKYVKYTEEEVEESATELKLKDPVSAIPGTMKLDAVVPISKDSIAVRELSCYCQGCLNQVTQSSCGWESKSFVKKSGQTNKTTSKDTPLPGPSISQPCSSESSRSNVEKESVSVNESDWVAAVYDESWYVGQVTEVDTDDCQINFLAKSVKYGNAYRFPLAKDEIWIQKSDILAVLKEVYGVGKAKRCFKLTDREEKSVMEKYTNFLNLKSS